MITLQRPVIIRKIQWKVLLYGGETKCEIIYPLIYVLLEIDYRLHKEIIAYFCIYFYFIYRLSHIIS